MNTNTVKLEASVTILEFEQQNRIAAMEILRSRYQIPKVEGIQLIPRIFDKISASKIWQNTPKNDILWKAFHKVAKVEAGAIKRSMSKNFGLTEREFVDLCVRLRDGDEQIFEVIFLKHIEDCIKYLEMKYRIDRPTAYDISMDTILEFRKKLIARKISYGNLRFLFTSMAGQIFLKTVRARKKTENVTSLYEHEDMEADYQILEQSLEELGDGCKKLLKQNIYDNVELKEIAELQNKTAVAIRKQKQRCLDRLKMLFRKNDKPAT